MSASDSPQTETLIRSTPPAHHGESNAPIRAQRSKNTRWRRDTVVGSPLTLTPDKISPRSKYASKVSTASIETRCCASTVDAAKCGVSKMFLAESSGLPFGGSFA